MTKYVKLTNAIYSKDVFAAVCPKADILMTGSDQVWNSVHNEGFDGHYFFQGIENVPKIAFCSSIGRESIDSIEANKIKSLLKEYKAISVREKSAVDILNDLGIKAEQLLDPTFLLNKKGWEKFSSPRKYKMPYILIYTPYNTIDKDLIYKSAKKLAKRFGLKIVTFSWIGLPERQADKTFLFANPGDFLSLMLHADYVITNSFHGTAFSINLNKQFWVFEPSAFSTRIKNILGLTGLDSRLLNNRMEDSDIASAIDYSQVNKVLESERIKSFDFLKNALS